MEPFFTSALNLLICAQPCTYTLTNPTSIYTTHGNIPLKTQSTPFTCFLRSTFQGLIVPVPPVSSQPFTCFHEITFQGSLGTWFGRSVTRGASVPSVTDLAALPQALTHGPAFQPWLRAGPFPHRGACFEYHSHVSSTISAHLHF